MEVKGKSGPEAREQGREIELLIGSAKWENRTGAKFQGGQGRKAAKRGSSGPKREALREG